MKNRKSTCFGFTLIELLVVVLIIGILAAVALPQYKKAVTKSRFAEAFANLKTLAQAHESCYMEKGGYCDLDELSVNIGNNFETDQFRYDVRFPAADDGAWARAQYKREDVCVCFLDEGEIILSQDYENAGCVDNPPSRDYAKLLKVREVGYFGCGCCSSLSRPAGSLPSKSPSCFWCPWSSALSRNLRW